MRVLINGLSTLKARTGVGHHIADLFAALGPCDPTSEFTLYPGATLSDWAGRNKAQPKPISEPSSLATPGFPARLRRKMIATGVAAAKLGIRSHFAAYSRRYAFDLYHEPNFVPLPTALPTVITVHDLSVLKFPEWHPADRVRYHKRHFLKGLNRAEHVIVVSEAVRREMIAELNCPSGRVSTVHNGIGPQFAPLPTERIEAARRDLGLPAKFFLCVGTVEPRKNLSTVLKAFIDLPAGVREGCPLILAGPWGWRAETDRELFEGPGRAAGAKHLGYVPASQLPALYGAARVLLYPSHYEGFGLPPIEMLACGGAVLASTAAALKEVMGPIGRLIAPSDVIGWREAMRSAATDDEYVAELARGGIDHAKQFNWQRAARETIAVYRRVLGRKSQ